MLDESDYMPRTKPRQLEGLKAETVFEEPSDKRHIVDDRRFGEGALLTQILLVREHTLFRRCGGTRRHTLAGKHSLTPEKFDEMAECC